MITKIDDFIEFLKEIEKTFSKNKFNQYENLTEDTLEIINLYNHYSKLFPINVSSICDNLLIEHKSNIDSLIHMRLKASYHLYIEYIKLDHDHFSALNEPVASEFQALFYYSKDFAFRLFAFFSKFYYWHYGKNKLRETLPINVLFLNEYTNHPNNYEFDSTDKILEKLKKTYSYEYENLDVEIRMKYCENNFELNIVEDVISCKPELKNAIRDLNAQYKIKLNELKKYKQNITKEAPKFSFEYPIDLIPENSSVVTITNSRLIFDALKPYLKQASFENRLKKLLDGEIISEKIDVKCGSHTFVNFIRNLNKENILTAPNLNIINDWIVTNFQFKKGLKYERFKKESVKTFIKSTAKDPKTKITYDI